MQTTEDTCLPERTESTLEDALDEELDNDHLLRSQKAETTELSVFTAP
jgi:hypothetical protein